ncbi:hypothetical protein [Neobacillus sp. Marseille-QA0830]
MSKAKANNNKPRQNTMDGGPIAEGVNSDNSFSDHGLENASKLSKAMKKGK